MAAPSRRSTFKTHPSMGLPSNWNVGDLEPSYTAQITVLNAVSGNKSSNTCYPHANSIALYPVFSDDTTYTDIVVSSDDGTGNFAVVATFLQVGLLTKNELYVGELVQNITLQGRAVIVSTQNFTGTGTVSIGIKRLN